jgi:biotin carboxylase
VVNISLPLLDQLSQLNYPAVVKPVSMSGSKGVIKANNEQECIAAVERIKPLLSQLANEEERTTILIEDFLDGPEVAYEGLLDKGRLRQLAIFDKPEPMNGPFFEESYYISPSRHSMSWQKIIHQRVSEACVAYGLTEGPIHAELRLIDKDAYIIEIAARTIGGDCADMLKFGLNIGLEELVLLQAMGKPIDIPEMKNSVGVLMIPIPEQGILRRVEGIQKARGISGITDIGISVREGYELLPLPEGSSYLGFIFAKAPTQQLVESALRAAHACLNVVIAPSFKVQLG